MGSKITKFNHTMLQDYLQQQQLLLLAALVVVLLLRVTLDES